MAKVALLIGVGEYLPSSGLQNLAAAARDVAAMRDVLVQPEIGGFAEADVTVLLNPEPQGMREALERLFAGRKADDLVVLYFSGHGVVDDFGTFHLTTARTDKGLLNSTAIPAGFVHGLMEGRGSKRQVVILDCCFSGAFANDMKAKGEAVNLQSQLGGKGRAVLTSSSATEYSFEQKEAALSVYTQYVVEGLRTGIADGDGDGWISVDELHEFAQAKVGEVAPAMQPRIYTSEGGYKIMLAQAPVGDPKLEYRKEVEALAEQKQGDLSSTILMALQIKQQQWGIDPDVAAAIRQEVLRPYEEFAAKVQTYKEALQKELQLGNQLTQASYGDLQYFQQTLGLKDENIQPLMQGIQILPPAAEASRSTENLDKPIVPPKPPIRVDKKVRGKTKDVSQHEQTAGIDTKSGGVAVAERPDSRKSTVPPSKLKQNRLTIVAVAVGSNLVFWGIISMISSAILTPSTPPKRAESSSSQVTANNKGAEEFFKKGLEKYNKQDYEGAIADYDQAIKLNPNYAEAYIYRGIARRALGDNNGAIADYDQAIKLKPDYATAYNGRGNARFALGDNNGAIADYDQAIKLKPDYANAYNGRGNARFALGDNNGAIADYDKSIELKNTEPWLVSTNRGNARRALGDNNGAIADYDQAIKLKPDYATAYFIRGNTRLDLGDNNGAIADYDQAIKLKPDYATAYNGRGNARFALGDNNGAIADYDQAIKLKPDNAEAYYNRGIARSALGDKKGAVNDYQQAADLYKQQGKTTDYEDALNKIKKLQQ